MSEIRIETLSQVHIGNGVFLHEGNDFLVDGNYAYVLNLDKLGTVIGTEQTIIQQWVKAINDGASGTFIRNHTKGISYNDISKRRILCSNTFNQAQNTLKEQLHDGFGRPYIPGSSIKGAIRTAVLSTLAKEKIGERLKNEDNKGKWKKIIFGMEDELLHFYSGDKAKKKVDPSNDLFRFLNTGDAYFEQGSELVVRQMNLNIREKDSLLDEKKQQAVEVIRKGAVSHFRMKVMDDFYRKSIISDFQGLQDLIELINNHTYQLICDEIEFWDKGEGAAYTGQDTYLDQLETILDSIDACQTNECVLRIGQASGWRFITGAWLEKIDRGYFKKEIVPLCRPRNNNYSQYPFPKSRRIDDASNVFGFVKLTVL